MTTVLTLVSTALWWVLYSSMAALVFALIGWCVLRWAEGVTVVFNRLYFACLIWALISIALIAAVAAAAGHLHPPYAPLLRSGALRWALVADMLVGVALIWRLTPRIDAHRVRAGSACMAVAAIMAIGFGVATSLA
ncbi:MAG TPA: hypothetical protein VIQ48_01205 [Rhodanobacter sp.]|jgi:uncharacterized membrane protein